MLFNSPEFLIFFVVVFSIYCTLAFRAQNVFLLAASLFFYAWWDWRFVFLLTATTSIDYIAGARIHAATSDSVRKRWLIASLACNLLVLGFFKYFNFFLGSFVELLNRLNLHVPAWQVEIILPLGISFYTFQSMAYAIDIYRRKLAPAQSFLNYFLFVCFFPHLIAGPINRPDSLLAQVEHPRRMSWQQWSEGALLILFGLFKKICVADVVAPFVDRAFSDPAQFNWQSLILGAYLFAVQIYADFSGYSDIARGLAKIFGFELVVNFNQPYFSRNPAEFWQRWHISLSRWLRDYLYIPLGGNRKGELRTYMNLLAVMLLGGLWHGANWTFVVWGAFHGAWLAAHRWWRERLARIRDDGGHVASTLQSLLFVVITFHIVTLLWIYFRSSDIATAHLYFSRLFGAQGQPFATLYQLFTLAWPIGMLFLLIDYPQWRAGDHLALLRWRLPARGAAIAMLALALLAVRPDARPPFIYFQF